MFLILYYNGKCLSDHCRRGSSRDPNEIEKFQRGLEASKDVEKKNNRNRIKNAKHMLNQLYFAYFDLVYSIVDLIRDQSLFHALTVIKSHENLLNMITMHVLMIKVIKKIFSIIFTTN